MSAPSADHAARSRVRRVARFAVFFVGFVGVACAVVVVIAGIGAPRVPDVDLPCDGAAARVVTAGPFDFTIRSTLTIAAPPAEVWGVLADLPGYAQWNSQLRLVSGAPAAGPITGQAITLELRPPHGPPYTFSPTVTAFAAPSTFAWSQSTGAAGLFDGVHHLVLTAVAGGTCLVNVERYSGAMTPLVRATGSFDGAEAGFDRMNAELATQVAQVVAR